MRIGVIGGVERTEAQYHRVAQSAGHTVEFHGGHMGGRGTAGLEALVERSDLVVIVTDVNSHGAVQVARRAARDRGRSQVLLRRLGVSRFAALLRALDAGEELHALAG